MPPECKPPPHYRRRSDHHHIAGDAPTTTFNPCTSPEKTTICNLFTPTETTTICKPYTPSKTTTSSNPFTHSFILHCLCTRHHSSSSHIKVIPLKRQVKVINDKEVEKALDEGYICEKFCEMSVIDADYLRGYNRCNICNAKKLAQRSDDETYKGIHTCLRLSVTTDSINESESALSILKNSDYSTTVTDNPSGLNCTKNGSASIKKWKREMEDIQSPFLKLQLASSYEPDMIISEVAENGSWNLSSSKVILLSLESI
ncbi:uncharacterized protein LOC110910703 isoform X3 [Helianthus annuus]|uniref:uncharacterized protein LOC110910703 isoform X3 n=1 Tax=Helianthus annuus TaxID=4232 RepID=UPI000B9044A5|nr:uncharacterized protein LOC110910703 isoform X3 [Helianthus annuus]